MISNKEERKRRIELRRHLIEEFPRERSSLLPALHYLQDTFSYLPDWAMEVVGWHLGVPASEIYGAATTYTELVLSPTSKKTVTVCDGVACRQNGSSEILDYLKKELESLHSKHPDDGFALQITDCAFMCSVAPLVAIDHKWFGRDRVNTVLARLSGESNDC